MSHGRRRLIGFDALILLASLSAGSVVSGSDRGPDTVKGVARSTTVMGIAWNANDSPIAAARIRLRSLQTTRITAATVTNNVGRFTFYNVEPGSYLVELVNEWGKVLAVGPMFNAAQGETVATFVRLGTRSPGIWAIFGNTAAAIVSAAAGLGITAVTPTGVDVSPETPPAAGGR